MHMTIPRDPLATKAGMIVAGLMLLLVALALWPHQDAPLAPIVRAEAPIMIIATAAPQPGPEPPPAQAPVVQGAAPTAEVPQSIIAAEPPSQLVHNADGSVSLPGSEAWMAPRADAATGADPIEQGAAEAYKALPIAAAPSAENNAPNYSRRPHTGR